MGLEKVLLWTVDRYRIKGQEKHIVFSADSGLRTISGGRRTIIQTEVKCIKV